MMFQTNKSDDFWWIKIKQYIQIPFYHVLYCQFNRTFIYGYENCNVSVYPELWGPYIIRLHYKYSQKYFRFDATKCQLVDTDGFALFGLIIGRFCLVDIHLSFNISDNWQKWLPLYINIKFNFAILFQLLYPLIDGTSCKIINTHFEHANNI